MPQLEQIHTYLSQVFWLLITFGVLYVVLWRVVLPRMAQILQTRQSKIDDDLARAEALKKEAEATLNRYQAAMGKARTEAQAIVRSAAERLVADAARRHEDLSRKLAVDAEAAERRIAAARQEALSNVQAVAVEVAEATVAKLLGDAVPAGQAAGAVARVLQERR